LFELNGFNIGARARPGLFPGALPYVFLGLLMASACSTTSKKQNLPAADSTFPSPPARALPAGGDTIAVSAALEKAFASEPSEAMHLWTRFQQAKLWTPLDTHKACGIWIEIAAQPRFPLAQLARLRAIETCPVERPEIAPMVSELSSIQEPWLRETAQRSGLRYALASQDKAREMRYSLEVAPFEALQADQLRLLERARSLARELSDAATDEQAWTQIEKTAPRMIKQPQPEQYLAVAADFRKTRDFNRAREFYRKVADGDGFSDTEKLRAFDGIRMTYKLEQKFEQFLAATRDYSAFARRKFFSSNTGRYFETQLTLARAIWTDGNPTEAEKILLKLEKEVQGKVPVDESVFIRARILEEGGRLADAAQSLANVVEARINDRPLRRKISWYHAWILRKNGQLKEAAERFTNLVLEEEESSSQVMRDHYWLGRTLKDAGDQDGANVQFDWLVANDPLGYYGILAHRELGRKLPAIGRPPVEKIQEAAPRAPAGAAAVAAALTPEERLTFDWLIAVDETELGRRFLDQIGSGRRANLNDAQALDYLQQYARAGAYQSLFGRLTDLPADTRKQVLDKYPELLFPRPWRSAVENAAGRFTVKPELIFSIMRQESSFNPLARSSADALGLMQLIPQVAEGTAAASSVPYRSHEDLYQPETNIALGSAHLRALLKRWNGLFIPTVASYNASERAVIGWLRTRDRKDPVQFIEDIPYEETKGYVKLVMRNFVFYSRLNTSEPEIAFPEWCLNGLQDFKP